MVPEMRVNYNLYGPKEAVHGPAEYPKRDSGPVRLQC